ADDRLVNSANGHVTRLVGHLERRLECDLAVGVNVRRNLQLHAHFGIRELRIDTHPRAYRSHTHWLAERTGSNWQLDADLNNGFFIVGGADARALQDLGAVIREEQFGDNRPDSQHVVGRVQVLQIVEVGKGRSCVGTAARAGGSAVGKLYRSRLW